MEAAMRMHLGPLPITRDPRTPLRAYVVGRLDRLVRLSAAAGRDAGDQPLLRRAVYWTNRDCRKLGMDDAARTLLAGVGLLREEQR
jgi:hypothetical protein